MDFYLYQFVLMWLFALGGTSFAASVKIVRQGDEALVELLGKYDGKKLEPGLTFIIPFLEQVAYKGTLKEQLLMLPPIQCLTAEKRFITLNIAIYWRILDLQKASYKVQNLQAALMTILLNEIRSEMITLKVEQLYTIRQEFNEAIVSALDVATEPWGVKITRVELMDFTIDDRKVDPKLDNALRKLTHIPNNSLLGYLHSNTVNLNSK